MKKIALVILVIGGCASPGLRQCTHEEKYGPWIAQAAEDIQRMRSGEPRERERIGFGVMSPAALAGLCDPMRRDFYFDPLAISNPTGLYPTEIRIVK